MASTKIGADRRMGPPGSENWHAMLDSGEDILREEGHAMLTSRRIAERVGVKQRLVYYYFRTMEDLIVAMFRRSSERDLKHLNDVIISPKPLHELWDLCFNTHDARLISEYMALANHIPDLRTEVIRFIEESRAIQVQAITAALQSRPSANAMPPAALALIATGIGLLLNREEQLGVESGHSEVKVILREVLNGLED